MNTKNVFKNLTILLVFTVGIFTIYSFTSTNVDTNDLTSYDESYYQNIDSNKASFAFAETTDTNDKCGGDKKAKKDKDAKANKDTKCGDDKTVKDAKADKDAKCGDGKCGDDKAAKDSTATKDAKCGTGKCG